MEEITLHLPLSKVIELVRQEERMMIKKFLATNLNQQTADYIDQYVPVESEVHVRASDEFCSSI